MEIKYQKISQHFGFTIIELSITLLISSIVMLALMNLFIASSTAQSSSQTLIESHESGRLVLNYLRKRIEQAGYNKGNINISPFYPTCNTSKINNGHCTYNSNSGTGDQLSIHRLMDNQTTCADTQISYEQEIKVIDSYWVEFNKNINSFTLYCLTYSEESREPIFVNNNSQMVKQPLSNGIRSLHLLYGITDNSQSGNVTRYISASEIDLLPTDLNSSIWQSIKAVKIALLSESHSSTITEKNNIYFYLLDADPQAFQDGKSRNIYSTTIALLND